MRARVVVLVICWLGCQLAQGFRTCVASPEEERRPNILIAVSDDQSWPHAGAYGCQEVSTPTFDRIAKRGVLFTRVFCAASQCSISRATLLAGRNPWQLEEAGVQASLFPAKYPLFTDLLSSVGYHVGYTGKPWAPGNWRAGGRTTDPCGTAYNRRKLEPPTSLISPIDYAGNFAEFLDDRAADTPFCFWFGCYEPHRDYEAGSGERAGKVITADAIPRSLPDCPEVRSDLADYFLEVEWFDKQLARIVAQIEEIGELENTLVLVTSDNGMPFPRAKATLYEWGTRMPFAVQWPGTIAGGQQFHDLTSFIDVAPTLLEAAGVDVPAEMSGRSFLSRLREPSDSAPAHRTFVLMGKERHNHARPENVGFPCRAIRTDKYLFIRNLEPERWPMGDPPGYFCHTKMLNPSKDYILAQRAGVSATIYRLTYAKRGSEELYDVLEDPACLQNLINEENLQRVAQELRDRLQSELVSEGDPRVLGFGGIFDSYPFFGRIQPSLGGFREAGKYNPAYWPTERGPVPQLDLR